MMKKQKTSRPAPQPVSDSAPQQASQREFPPWLFHPLMHLALIILVGILCYANTFSAAFNFDDAYSIVDNPVIKNLSSFLSGAGYAYNPRRFAGFLTIALNYHFGGLNVTGYHVVNLVIHLITACLVYALAKITFRTPFFVNGDNAVSGNRLTVNGNLEPVNGISDPLTAHGSQLTAFIPLFAALLFVAHPIQTQAVTYIIQRLASLVTLFYLAAMVSYVKARLAMIENRERLTVNGEQDKAQDGDRDAVNGSKPVNGEQLTVNGRNTLLSERVVGWLALALVFTLLAMRTKEVAATLPLAIVLYEFSFFGATGRKRLLLLVPGLLTLLIIPIGIILSGKPAGELLSDVSAMTRETVAISRGDYLLTQFSVIATYIRLIFLPINQNLDYDYPVYHSLFTPKVFLSFLLICSLIALAVWLFRKSVSSERLAVNEYAKPLTDHGSPITDSYSPLTTHGSPFTAPYRLIAFGIFWFFITQLVESSIIPIRDVIFEHRVYLPAVGAFLAISAGAALLLRHIDMRLVVAVAAGLVLALGTATFARNRVWQDELTMWQDVLAKSPEKARPYNVVGILLRRQGRIDEAIPYLQKAVELKPDFESYDNLGVALYAKGMRTEAEQLLLKAKESDPGYAPTYTNLGKLYLDAGDLPNALQHLEKACQLTPNSPLANNNLGSAYLQAKDYPKAIVYLEKAHSCTPEDLDVRYNLSAAYYLAGSRSKAVAELTAILQRNPAHTEAQNLLQLIKAQP